LAALAEESSASAWAVDANVKPESFRPSIMALVSAVAASILAAIVIFSLTSHREGQKPSGPPGVAKLGEQDLHSGPWPSTLSHADVRELKNAMADATAATWELARFASEPTARISRGMLDAATDMETGHKRDQSTTASGSPVISVTMPSLSELAPDPSSASAMFQDVSDRLASGVRPLSKTARHAFSFLLGPAPGKPEGRGTRPPATAKGA
jgi:hypothetical protein